MLINNLDSQPRPLSAGFKNPEQYNYFMTRLSRILITRFSVKSYHNFELLFF